MEKDVKYVINMLNTMHKDGSLSDRTPINLLEAYLEKIKEDKEKEIERRSEIKSLLRTIVKEI